MNDTALGGPIVSSAWTQTCHERLLSNYDYEFCISRTHKHCCLRLVSSKRPISSLLVIVFSQKKGQKMHSKIASLDLGEGGFGTREGVRNNLRLLRPADNARASICSGGVRTGHRLRRGLCAKQRGGLQWASLRASGGWANQRRKADGNAHGRAWTGQ
jgi:hypothetical protein